MMKRCPSCNKGKLSLSGTHLYCGKCSYTQFVPTNEYVDACAALSGTLLSNTKFVSERAVLEIVERQIYMHMPQLHSFIQSLAQGQQPFLKSYVEQAKTQAINLQIGVVMLNQEELARDLRCQCGHDEFNMLKIGELQCKACDAVYEYNEAEGFYTPYFLCKCGQATYEELDESGMVQCKGCGSAYMHDKKNKLFRRLS